MPRILISCGEPSGDLYGGALVRELRRLAPDSEVFGLGGDRLRDAGATLLADYRGLSVTGLSEAVRVIPRSWSTYRSLVAAARRMRPDVFVPIDFPDFNFRLAHAMRRLGVPVVYYISPQLWAWRPGRLRSMKRMVERVLVIFPFEEEVYRSAGVPVQFVGHPLRELAQATRSRDTLLRSLGLDPRAHTVALLPGSRPNEVRAMLPVMLSAACLVANRVPDAQWVIARAPNLDDGLFAMVPDATRRPPVRLVEAATDDVLAAADVVVTASGTATVQAALHGRPMVIVYRVSELTYRVGRRFVRVDTFGMVNLVAGRRIAPELIQDDFTPAAVADHVTGLLTDEGCASAMQAELARVLERLGPPGASRRAAEAVLEAASATHRTPALSAGGGRT